MPHLRARSGQLTLEPVMRTGKPERSGCDPAPVAESKGGDITVQAGVPGAEAMPMTEAASAIGLVPPSLRQGGQG